MTDVQSLNNTSINSTIPDNQINPANDQSGGSNLNVTVVDGGNVTVSVSNETNGSGNNTVNAVQGSTETGGKLRKKLF